MAPTHSTNNPYSAAHLHFADRLRTGSLPVKLANAMPLPQLVEATLTELMATKESFTAYDVTMILRALFPNPQRDLPHYPTRHTPGIQPETHRQMARHLYTGAYTAQIAYPNGVDPARLYVPR